MSSGGTVKKRHKKHHVEELNIIPLIDITANLLFFLMVGMDMKQQEDNPAKIELPPSTSKSTEESPMVRMVLGKEELLVEGVRQAVVKDGKFPAAELGKGGQISRLGTELEKRRKTFEASGLDLTVEKNKPVVLLMADRALPYETLEAVMRTAGGAGFPRFRFAVLSK